MPGSKYFSFCRFFCRILPLKRWPRSSVRFYTRANDSQFTSTDLAVFVHLSHFEETAIRPIQVTNYRSRVPLGQEAYIFCFALSRSSMKFYVRANNSPFTSPDLAVFVHLCHFKTTTGRSNQVTNYGGRVPLGQEANIYCFALSFIEYCR